MTTLVAVMLAFSLVAAAGPALADEGDNNDEFHALENDEGLYLVFGADLGDQTLEEYIETQANPGDDVDVVEYTDVENVEVTQEGQAASVSIDGGEAVAIQDATQQNANSQTGEATAVNAEVDRYSAEFENVGDVTLIFGNGDDQRFTGWGIGDGDGEEISVSQVAEATVQQGQEVAQANVNQQSTALAFAENGSEAVAFQLSQQSNLNLQEGAANATNVFAADLDEDKDRHAKHKKHDGGVGIDADQDADATVEQVQVVDQLNVNEQHSAVAIAVGSNSSATAIQMTDQTNLNEQVGTAEAANILMQTAGMNVAMAGTDAGNDLLTKDGKEKLHPEEKKGHDDKADVTQTAEASVTQIQSVEQANFNNQSAAVAIAVNDSQATAVQLSFQQNINAQIASADALNIFEAEIGDGDEHKKGEKKHTDEHNFDSLVLTNTTSVTLDGDAVEGASHLSFDYDGSNEQLNDVEQWSNAEVQQSQEIMQVNLNQQQGAFAVAEDNGSADTVQLTIQENENIQFASAESTTVAEGELVGDDPDDHKKGEDDHDRDEHDDHDKDEHDDHDKTEHDDEKTGQDDDRSSDRVGPSEDDDGSVVDDEPGDSIPGFGVLVALVALGIVGAARFVSER
ncbi:PGF-CTERM sorting domain-containing protein [Natronobeatus ordinarius]|uniref:PGF-CTERM sorting domain-containing protein n=1 Tax=Natronobeatus ordinarius TaxID=2963433 RepID=UPI0031F314EE